LRHCALARLTLPLPVPQITRHMNSITSLTPKALRRAADIQERILKLQNEITQLLGAPAPAANGAPAAPKRRRMSAAGRAAIAPGARARWAKLKGTATAAPKGARKPKRKMSAAGRAKLSVLAKARWKKAKAAGKGTL
jgi:hypothetical protein